MHEIRLLLAGCGKMGTALLQGWLESGLETAYISVIEPQPSPWLENLGVELNSDTRANVPDVCVIAVKPQVMSEAIEPLRNLGGGRTMVLSIAAGTTIARLERVFGSGTPVVRSMPNTPAAVGRGVTAYVGNRSVGERHLDMAERLLSAVGETVRVERESDMDIVTGVSGSGPAYVFHLIECLADAAEKAGLPADTATKLAIETIAGAGMLAREAEATPGQLRVNVTSPAGTTEAGLKHLMDGETGLQQLIDRTVTAAIARSRELGRDD